MSRPRRIARVEQLLSRRVRGEHGEVVGRIEDIRVERRDDVYEVVEYLLGPGALAERLALVRRWFGRTPKTLVARWDQLDISVPDEPRLTCAAGELKHE